jgi:hypothetical protein
MFPGDSLRSARQINLVLPQGFAMTIRIAALLIGGCLAAAPQCGLGQEADDLPDSSLTREQWQQRIEEARRRSEAFVANTRIQTVPSLRPEQKDAEAAERAMNDPSLREGDIVATGNGFVVFVGRDEAHQPQDFQRQDFRSATPSQRSPPR